MEQPQYRAHQVWAGRCQTGGSDKVWAAALVETVDSDSADPATEARWYMLSVYGKTGGNLQGGALPSPTTRQKAEAVFDAKVKEKAGAHAYVPVDFAPFVPAFKVPVLLPDGVGSTTTATSGAAVVETDENAQRYRASIVVAVDEARLERLLVDDRFGVSEKVNGERCVIFSDGSTVQAYNRRGVRMSLPPAGALPLLSLGVPFVVDGERLTGEQGGHYVLFDLLAWNGQDVREQPYADRMGLLQRALYRVGLVVVVKETPSYRTALRNSGDPQLALLTVCVGGSDQARQLVNEVRDSGGEGVIIRKLDGTYDGARAVQKFKFLSEVDAVVVGFTDGGAEGSASLGLYRGDGALIAVGNVRAGLSAADMRELKRRFAEGERPVLTVRYLGARTVGVALVEPQTSLEWLREDKLPQECTTDQLGPDKAQLVEQAVPLILTLP